MISRPENGDTRARGSSGAIRSVDKVVDILELLGRESRGLPISELAVAFTGLRPIQARRMHRPGQSHIHSTASGKLLLAHQPPEQAAP